MSITRIENLPKIIPFHNILKEIEEKFSCKIYLVGGAVRDILLHSPTADFDLVAEDIDYLTFAKSFAKKLQAPFIPFKDNVRIVKNLKGKLQVVDISKLRGKTILEDLEKRDFTINNLAADISGQIYGSTADLEAKMIRLASPKSFDDDPLRIMRLYRFASQLGFEVDSHTLEVAIQKKELLKNIASERLTEELRKLLAGKHLINAITLLKKENPLSTYYKDSKEHFDYDALLRQNCSYSFSLSLALLLKGDYKALLTNLSLSKAELKELERYKSINYESLLNMSEDDLKRYAFMNDKYIDEIRAYIDYKFNNKELSELIHNLHHCLNLEKASLLTGERLKELGYLPSKDFGIILNDLKFELATGKIELEDIKAIEMC